MGKDPWYRKTLRWGQTNLVEIDPARYDGEWWRAHWEKTRVQGVIINAGGIVAYYPSQFDLHHRAQGIDDRDLYGEVVAAAREEGLAVIARMDSNRVSQDFYEAHPDWMCRDANGEPYRRADKYVTCINSPYYSAYLPAVMEEIVERSRPDGFADNSWAGLARSSICHCDHCKHGFAEKTGYALPSSQDWSSEVYLAWIKWNFECRVRLWEHNNSVTMAAGGEDCRWMGMISGDVLYNGERFIDLKAILARSEIIMLDHQRRSAADGFEGNTEAGKRLHQLIGWDKLIPESTPQYLLGAPAFRLASMPEPEMRLWATSGFAGGIQPWWHHIGSCHDDRRQYQSAEPLFVWHEANQDILVNREPVADIGVVWSQANHDFCGRGQAADRTMAAYRGAIKAIDRAGLTYLPVHADDIADMAHRFKVLVLPDIGAMSDESVAAVEAFTKNGGSVIATSETSSRDQQGRPRDALALGPLFGVSRGSGEHGAIGAADISLEVFERHSYIRFANEQRANVYGPKDPSAPSAPDERAMLFDGFEATDTVPFGGHLPVFSVAEDVEVLATYVPAFPIFPPETSWMREPVTELPAITMRKSPNGGALIWLVADLDRCFARDGLPDHARLVGNALDWALDNKAEAKVEGGHGFITPTLYRQKGRHILHLNNRLTTSPIPGRQHSLVSPGPVEVRLTFVGSEAPTSVDLRVAGKPADYRMDNGTLVVALDSIEDHEVVVIEHAH